MKKLTLCLALTITVIKAYTQDFPPVGAFWNYSMISHNGGLSGNQTIIVAGDTLLNGITQKVLVKRFQYTGIPPCTTESGEQFLGYMFQRNDSVFFGDQFNQHSYLYGFHVNFGDTLPHPFYAQQGVYYVADSIGNLVIAGDTLTKTYFTRYCNGSSEGMMTLVENIGPIDDYLLLDYDNSCLMLAGCAESSHEFGCFSDGNISYPGLCNPVLTSIAKINSTKAFSVFTDLSGKRVAMHFALPQNGILSLTDLQGRQFTSLPVTATLSDYSFDISSLSPGIYFIRFADNRQQATRTEKLIIPN